MKYYSVSTGNELIVKPDMFYWRGLYFSGLVDEKNNALYDNPADSFNEHVGLKTSLECNLITTQNRDVKE